MPDNPNVIVDESIVGEEENEDIKESTDNFFSHDDDEEIEEDPKEGQDEEEFEEIQYNKETIKIPKNKVKEYLQKGYHSDKVYQQRDEYKAKYEELKNKENQEKYQNERNNKLSQTVESLIDKGFDEEQAREIAELKLQNEEFKNQTAQAQMSQRSKEYMAKVEKDEPAIFNALKEETLKTMETNNVTFDIAYQYVKGGKSWKELNDIQNSSSNTRVQNEYDNRRRGGVVSSSDSKGKDYSTEITDPHVKGLVSAFGLNPSKVGKRISQARKQHKV